MLQIIFLYAQMSIQCVEVRRGREFESRSYVFVTTVRDKACQCLATGHWFSPGYPVSSTNTTDHHDIPEILLKVVLNTLTLTLPPSLAVLVSSLSLTVSRANSLKQLYMYWHSDTLFSFQVACLVEKQHITILWVFGLIRPGTESVIYRTRNKHIHHYLVVKLKLSLRKFYGHQHNLVNRCEISVSQITTDIISLS